MKKKIILGIVGLVLVTLVALCTIFYMKNQRARALIAHVPSVMLQTADGRTVDLAQITKGHVSVIFFFHPQCSFCGMEMQEILAHKDDLSDVNLVFVTTSEGEELTSFLDELPIDDMPNSTVLVDQNRDFVTTYNVQSPPSCYIYDAEQKLRKYYRGTTPVSAVLKIVDG